jgi:hypothetical protein
VKVSSFLNNVFPFHSKWHVLALCLHPSTVFEQRKPLHAVQITVLFCFVKRNWKAGQPDNWGSGHGPGEDCAGLIYAGQWNDFQCDEINNFICEKEREAGKQPHSLLWSCRAWVLLKGRGVEKDSECRLSGLSFQLTST